MFGVLVGDDVVYVCGVCKVDMLYCWIGDDGFNNFFGIFWCVGDEVYYVRW